MSSLFLLFWKWVRTWNGHVFAAQMPQSKGNGDIKLIDILKLFTLSPKNRIVAIRGTLMEVAVQSVPIPLKQNLDYCRPMQ